MAFRELWLSLLAGKGPRCAAHAWGGEAARRQDERITKILLDMLFPPIELTFEAPPSPPKHELTFDIPPSPKLTHELTFDLSLS
jgi:hypothetical protein